MIKRLKEAHAKWLEKRNSPGPNIISHADLHAFYDDLPALIAVVEAGEEIRKHKCLESTARLEGKADEWERLDRFDHRRLFKALAALEE